MALPEPIRSFFYEYESLAARNRRTPWGLAVTDARYPRVYDANKAVVLEEARSLTLGQLLEDLTPMLDASGIGFEHLEFMDLGDESPALAEAAERSGRVHPDVVMVHEARADPTARGSTELDVREVTDPDEAFWSRYRASRNEFGEIMADEVVDELVRRDREVFVPAGLRLFGGYLGDELAGFTSLMSMAGAGYVDNVVTMPEFRRRGIASTLVTRAVTESRAAGDRVAFLLAELDGSPQRLYERIGFRVIRGAAGYTSPRAQGNRTAP